MNKHAVLSSIAMGLVLAGCGSSPERATTVGSAASAETKASAAPKPKGAGDQLDAAQAKAALLTAADLPTGWSVTPSEPQEEDSDDKVEPAECDELLNSLDETGDKGNIAAEADGSYTGGGMLGTQLEMSVTSYKSDGLDKNIQKVADALTKCSKITTTDADGVESEMTISPLSFPNLGEQTLAMRMNVASEGMSVVADVVMVATGHNVVSFLAAGLQPMDGKALEEVSRKGMERVAAAAKS